MSEATTILLIWFSCGAVTATLLVLSALVGRRLQYIRRHKLLLLAAIICGPLGWLIALGIGCIRLIIVRIGNNGGFQ